MEKIFLFFRVTSNPHNICRYFVSRQEIRTLKALLYCARGSDLLPLSTACCFLERPYNQLVRLKLWVHHGMVQSQKLVWKSCDEIVFLESGLSPVVIIETCLFILWRHLEYYLLHCTPTDSQDSLFASRSLFKSRRLQGKLHSEN